MMEYQLLWARLFDIGSIYVRNMIRGKFVSPIVAFGNAYHVYGPCNFIGGFEPDNDNSPTRNKLL